jgi:hypothetical protein
MQTDSLDDAIGPFRLAKEYHVTDISIFRDQLAKLPRLCAAAPEGFGEGVNLLLSCGSRNVLSALAEAEARGIAARGVGRMHILVEIENAVPDKNWVETKGNEIAHFFEQIAGTDPQISFDRSS